MVRHDHLFELIENCSLEWKALKQLACCRMNNAVDDIQILHPSVDTDNSVDTVQFLWQDLRHNIWCAIV